MTTIIMYKRGDEKFTVIYLPFIFSYLFIANFAVHSLLLDDQNFVTFERWQAKRRVIFIGPRRLCKKWIKCKAFVADVGNASDVLVSC